MRTIRHSLNYIQEQGQVFLKPTKTVPDMAIPLEVLIDRYVRGIDPMEHRAPYWQTEQESPGMYVPDVKSLDLVDIQEMRIQAETVRGQIIKDIQAEKEAKKQKLINPPKDEEKE